MALQRNVQLITEGAHPNNIMDASYQFKQKVRYGYFLDTPESALDEMPYIALDVATGLIGKLVEIHPSIIFKEGIRKAIPSQVVEAFQKNDSQAIGNLVVEEYPVVYQALKNPNVQIFDLDKGFEPYEKGDTSFLRQRGRESHWVKVISDNYQSDGIVLVIVGEGHRVKGSNGRDRSYIGRFPELLNAEGIGVDHIYTSPDLDWIMKEATRKVTQQK